MRLMGFVHRGIFFSLIPLGKTFQWHFLTKFTNSYVTFYGGCERVRFDGPSRESLRRTLLLPLKGQTVSVKESASSKSRKTSNFTFAVSVWTSEDGAFLDAAKGLKQTPHIIF